MERRHVAKGGCKNQISPDSELRIIVLNISSVNINGSVLGKMKENRVEAIHYEGVRWGVLKPPVCSPVSPGK